MIYFYLFLIYLTPHCTISTKKYWVLMFSKSYIYGVLNIRFTELYSTITKTPLFSHHECYSSNTAFEDISWGMSKYGIPAFVRMGGMGGERWWNIGARSGVELRSREGSQGSGRAQPTLPCHPLSSQINSWLLK